MDYHELIEELARVRRTSASMRAANARLRKHLGLRSMLNDALGRALQAESKVAILTRLVGHLQDEIAARDTVLRVIEEARGETL